jgi:hypothetical protein
VAQIVHRPRRQFLARAGLAHDQHWHVSGGEPRQLVKRTQERGASPISPVAARNRLTTSSGLRGSHAAGTFGPGSIVPLPSRADSVQRPNRRSQAGIETEIDNNTKSFTSVPSLGGRRV